MGHDTTSLQDQIDHKVGATYHNDPTIMPSWYMTDASLYRHWSLVAQPLKLGVVCSGIHKAEVRPRSVLPGPQKYVNNSMFLNFGSL